MVVPFIRSVPPPPLQVLLPIFSLLDPETLKSCRLVSPAWNQLILEKLAGDRFVLRARKLEISEELAGEFAKADSRLWRNVSYHGDLHDEAQHPEGYDDHGLQVFFRTMRRQGANGPWEEVRSLDVFVRNTREFWALETGRFKSSFFRFRDSFQLSLIVFPFEFQPQTRTCSGTLKP